MDVNMNAAVPIFRQYGIKKAAVFGSAARDESRNDSDIDIIVSFMGRYSLLDLVGLKQDLEEVCNKPVDLITYDALKNDEFARVVLKDAKIIYEQG